jgi:ribosomal protein S18 acetylase RimI-like enzyme
VTAAPDSTAAPDFTAAPDPAGYGAPAARAAYGTAGAAGPTSPPHRTEQDAVNDRNAVTPAAPHPLDNPARSALTGPHAALALRKGRVLRYPADVSPFYGLPGRPDDADWADAAALAAAHAPAGEPPVVVTAVPVQAPAGWEKVFEVPGVQLGGEAVAGVTDPEVVRLGPADLAEMLDLTARTKPGPFLPRTPTLGSYLGIRSGGVLVAMAGERMQPPGWTEISAVCTDPDHRGRGLAGRLVLAVAAVIQARGETPFLHAASENTGAIRLYEALGFRLRKETVFTGLTVPALPAP